MKKNGVVKAGRNGARSHRPRKKAAKEQRSNSSGGFTGGSSTRQTSSWVLSGLSADAEIRTHLFALRNRCRDLERNNDYARGFGEDVEANVLGSEGVLLQMKVKEEADRIIHNPDEKAFILDYEERTNKRRAEIRKKLVRRGIAEELTREIYPDIKLLHGGTGKRAAKVLKGQPDVFANNLIERAWKKFSLKQNFSVTRELTRHEAERLWLRSTWRDGSCLVRKHKGFENDFGFALEFIDMDWLDLNYNVVLGNGNEVRMGKEYNQWKECVAYHIITRQPGDWMWSTGVAGYSGGTGRFNRRRILAEEIIHGYVRERIDQSREIPWLVSVITRLQMLGKWEEAALVASLLSARKTGTWYSTMGGADPETLTRFFKEVAPGDFEEATEPGQDTIAPFGYEYKVNDPKWPNANVEQFRKVMLQGVAAGLPGASYHRVSQDPSGLSFSNLRGIELQSREGWMMIQSFMRGNFHGEIFPPFLESALMSGEVPLPVSKYDKFNAPAWTFRKWKGIDPIKEAEANRANLLLANTTRTRIAAESGADFEEIIEQLIVEEDLLEISGLQALSLANLNPVPNGSSSTSDGSGDTPPKVPAEGKEPAPEE